MKKITIAILTISILAVGIIGYKTLESTTTKSTASIRDSYNRYDKNNNILTLKSIEITSPTNGNYQEGEKIEFKVTWSGKVYSRLGREIKKVTSPDLYIKFGNGYRKKADFVKQEEDSLYYEYIIRRTDYGKIELVKYEGNVYDRDKSKVIIGEVSLSGNVDITANNQNNNP